MAEVRAIGVAKGDVRKRRNSREKSGFYPSLLLSAGNARDKGWMDRSREGGWTIVARKSVDCSGHAT